MSREEMDHLGWDSCDIIIVSGDGYVDHPSFGMAVIGRVLEAQGFRVGMIAQPDWQSVEPITRLIVSDAMTTLIRRVTYRANVPIARSLSIASDCARPIAIPPSL
jgi:hypothetical protein